MGTLLDRFGRRPSRPDTSSFFARVSAGYEPLVLPCRGNPATLSGEQVALNHEYLQRHEAERERGIKHLLAQDGVHWPEDLSGPDAAPLVTATREWAKAHWPALRKPVSSLDIRHHWLCGERSGDFIGLSVVSDTALLLGQYIVANRGSLAWGMDTDPVNRADGMASVNRRVLLGDWVPDPAITVVIDVEAVVLTLFVDPGDSSERLFDTWGNLIRDCLSGRYEGVSLA